MLPAPVLERGGEEVLIWLITGASHTGKTLLAQRLLETYRVPYLSIDHLKMGMIRSGMLALTVQDDEPLTEALWPVVREIVKTAAENRQHLIVEGGYIPFTWREDFPAQMLEELRYCCLVMTEGYIRSHMDEIRGFANAIEQRLDDGDCTAERLVAENRHNLEQCQAHGCPYCLIESDYQREIAGAERLLRP